LFFKKQEYFCKRKMTSNICVNGRGPQKCF
jgi:hypothetical protein